MREIGIYGTGENQYSKKEKKKKEEKRRKKKNVEIGRQDAGMPKLRQVPSKFSPVMLPAFSPPSPPLLFFPFVPWPRHPCTKANRSSDLVHYLTMTFLNASDISLALGAAALSVPVDMPLASLSSINLRRTGGNVSSVARIVRRTI